MRAGGLPVRESDVLVGATFPAKTGQVYFGRFYLRKRRFSAKWAASPGGKRPQTLRIDDGKGFLRLSLPCRCAPRALKGYRDYLIDIDQLCRHPDVLAVIARQ